MPWAQPSLLRGTMTAVPPIIDLTGCGRIIGNHHGLAQHLSFAHNDALAFVTGRVHIDITLLNVRIGIRRSARKSYDTLHTPFLCFGIDGRMIARAYDVPMKGDTQSLQMSGYIRNTVIVLCLTNPTDRQ